MLSSQRLQCTLHFFIRIQPDEPYSIRFVTIMNAFDCVLRCKGETLHKVSVNTPKRRCVHIFLFEPTWLSCRNCLGGSIISCSSTVFSCLRSAWWCWCACICSMLYAALLRITLGIFDALAVWVYEKQLLNGNGPRKTKKFFQHTRSLEMDTNRCRQRRDDKFKTNNLHSRVTRRWARKPSFLENDAGITYTEFSAYSQRLSLEKHSPSLRWLNVEVSWHSGSAQNRFCNFFCKHSAMVLKNLFVSSSDVQATRWRNLIVQISDKAREASGRPSWPRISITLVYQPHSHSCVNQAIRLLLRLWNGKVFSANDFDKRNSHLSPWGLHK